LHNFRFGGCSLSAGAGCDSLSHSLRRCAEGIVVQVSVPRRRPWLCMPQKRTHNRQRRSATNENRGICVPEIMKANAREARFFDYSPPGAFDINERPAIFSGKYVLAIGAPP